MERRMSQTRGCSRLHGQISYAPRTMERIMKPNQNFCADLSNNVLDIIHEYIIHGFIIHLYTLYMKRLQCSLHLSTMILIL